MACSIEQVWKVQSYTSNQKLPIYLSICRFGYVDVYANVFLTVVVVVTYPKKNLHNLVVQW